MTVPDVRADTMHVTTLSIKLAVIFSGQAVVAWFFYRGRADLHLSWADSDLVVFGIPLLIGFATAASVIYSGISKVSGPKRMAVAITLSGIGAIIASFVGAMIAFNLYGT